MNIRYSKYFFNLWIAIFFLTLLTVTGCNKDNNNNVNFTIDMTQSQFAALNNVGQPVVYNGIIIVEDANFNYIAVSAYCTVDNDVLSFNVAGSYFYCPNNNQFNEQGVEINTPGAPSLISYHVTRTNNFLQIYS